MNLPPIREAAALRSRGWSRDRIAKHYDVELETINRWLRDYDDKALLRDWLTVPAVAKAIGRGEKHVLGLIKRGALKAVDVGGWARTRVHRKEVLRYILW